MRLAVLVLGMLAAKADAASPYHTQVSGTQLVRDMLADPKIGDNLVRRERAMGYIDGVMEASAGIRWCPVGKPIPHELNYLVVEDIAVMAEARQKGDVSALIQAVLAKKYPCSAHGAKP